MILVSIIDSEENYRRDIHYSKSLLQTDDIVRQTFMDEVQSMIGSFLQELKAQAKEENK